MTTPAPTPPSEPRAHPYSGIPAQRKNSDTEEQLLGIYDRLNDRPAGLAQPPPPTPPPGGFAGQAAAIPDPPSRRRRTLIAWAAAGAVVVAFVLAVGHSQPRSLRDQVLDWGASGGGQQAQRVAAAARTAAYAQSNADVVLACRNVADAADDALAYRPIPDPIAQEFWSNGMRHMKAAANYCVTAARTNSWAFVGNIRYHSNMVTSEMKKATARIDEIKSRGY